MKQKLKHINAVYEILLGALIVIISGALTVILLKALEVTPPTESAVQQSSQAAAPTPAKGTAPVAAQTYAEFSEWKIRFPTAENYTLKRNSGTGNMAAYFVTIDSLAANCATPDTPWLGLLSQYTPTDLIQNGPNAGKTYEQVFGSEGTTINGKLYVFDTMTQFCTRNKPTPVIDEAAEKLMTEIKGLVAY